MKPGGTAKMASSSGRSFPRVSFETSRLTVVVVFEGAGRSAPGAEPEDRISVDGSAVDSSVTKTGKPVTLPSSERSASRASPRAVKSRETASNGARLRHVGGFDRAACCVANRVHRARKGDGERPLQLHAPARRGHALEGPAGAVRARGREEVPHDGRRRGRLSRLRQEEDSKSSRVASAETPSFVSRSAKPPRATSAAVTRERGECSRRKIPAGAVSGHRDGSLDRAVALATGRHRMEGLDHFIPHEQHGRRRRRRREHERKEREAGLCHREMIARPLLWTPPAPPARMRR